MTATHTTARPTLKAVYGRGVRPQVNRTTVGEAVMRARRAPRQKFYRNTLSRRVKRIQNGQSARV